MLLVNKGENAMRKQKIETQTAISWQLELRLTPELIDNFIS